MAWVKASIPLAAAWKKGSVLRSIGSRMATLGKYNDQPGSAGKTIALAEVRLFDDYNRPVGQGQVGEIVMKGPMVFKGYWNLPEDNAQTFREGWHHTGDLGRFDEDGFLWYAGRKAEKELIKPGGENVYPREVEEALYTRTEVEDCAVVGVPDREWGERVVAYVVPRKDQRIDRADMDSFLRTQLSSFKIPKEHLIVQELPKSPQGKILKKTIRSKYWKPQAPDAEGDSRKN